MGQYPKEAEEFNELNLQQINLACDGRSLGRGDFGVGTHRGNGCVAPPGSTTSWITQTAFTRLDGKEEGLIAETGLTTGAARDAPLAGSHQFMFGSSSS